MNKWLQGFGQKNKKSTQLRKRAGEKQSEESTKRQKKEDDTEKEELRASMDVAPRDDVAIDVESLATKYPIFDWKTHVLTENMMYYKIIRADGSSKNYKIFSEMIDDFDRQNVMDLHRLVQERRRIDKEGNVSRFQEYHTSDEEEEFSEHPPYNKYGFVDHPQLQMEDQRIKFAPYPLPPQEGNMNGWLTDDANDSDLESTASNQPMSLTMEDIGGS
ncbi:hypothetical protein Tco_1047591 [Tanacetum coccineum]